MKIQYVQNIINVNGFSEYGEMVVLIKDGIPISHHYISDGYLRMVDVIDLLEPFGMEIELENIEETMSDDTLKLLKK